jgi:dihydrofolate reductase
VRWRPRADLRARTVWIAIGRELAWLLAMWRRHRGKVHVRLERDVSQRRSQQQPVRRLTPTALTSENLFTERKRRCQNCLSTSAADGWPGWWGLEGPEYLAWLGDQPEADYTVLMGANTYRVMSGLATDGEPGTEALAGMSKVVFSTTLTEPLSWANTPLVTQDPVEAVREMKDKGTKSMRTLGSLTLCRSLLKAGLVDRFRVVVFPVITGSTGRDRIYDGYPDVSLDMVSSRTFDGRIQLLEYVPTVLAGPPGTPKADV